MISGNKQVESIDDFPFPVSSFPFPVIESPIDVTFHDHGTKVEKACSLRTSGYYESMRKGRTGQRFKTAFILGAGLGTRLLPLTEKCPKPLLDLGGRPIITYAMDHLLGIGVERFIVNTHHLPEVYLEKFPDRKWKERPILFRHEPTLLDTAGGLKNIEELLHEDETIICYNGDIVADFPLSPLVRFHNAALPEATLALRSRGPVLNVAFDGEKSVCDIRDTLGHRGALACLFTGIYAVETSLFHHMESGKVESVVSIFLERIRENPGSIAGIIIDEGNWWDIGSLEIYNNLNSRIPFEEK
jgi:mannose-1-phosphate guanylyltransferase